MNILKGVEAFEEVEEREIRARKEEARKAEDEICKKLEQVEPPMFTTQQDATKPSLESPKFIIKSIPDLPIPELPVASDKYFKQPRNKITVNTSTHVIPPFQAQKPVSTSTIGI